MRSLIKVLWPFGAIQDPLSLTKKTRPFSQSGVIDAVAGKGSAAWLNDPMNLGPKRPVVHQAVTASGDPTARRAQGYRAGLMGLSRLTG